MFFSPAGQALRSAFSTNLQIAAETEPHLRGALQETLGHPGNLIRAQLACGLARVFGLGAAAAQDLAVAIEYFHTASLLLDDLPFMDDATQRRGAPCVHHTHGESAAVLAALALINRAYSLLWRAMMHAPAAHRSSATEYVEKCLGIDGILNGQSQDLHYATLSPGYRSPQKVAIGKTVSLIRLSLVLPGILTGIERHEIRLLERLALFWGLSYQIIDDFKDVFPKSAPAGKTIARDASLNRPNLVLAIGAEAALARLERGLRIADRTVLRLVTESSALHFLTEPCLRFRQEVSAVRAAMGTVGP